MKALAWIAVVGSLQLALVACVPNGKETAVPEQAVRAGFDVPAPVLVEARDRQIGLDSFKDELSVHVDYPAMAAGHTVGLRWQGKKSKYLPVQTVKQAGPLVFKVPRELVEEVVGGTARLTSSVGVNGSNLIISDPIVVTVVKSLPFDVPAPKLLGIDKNGDYRPGSDVTTVEVDYPGMKVGDMVGLRWKGRKTRDLSLKEVKKVAPVSFEVPFDTVSLFTGSAVIISASVGGDGNPLRISQALSARILERMMIEAPTAEQASKGELDLNLIMGSTTIKVDGQQLRKGDTVGMRWQGGARLDLPTQRFGGTGDIRFQVAKDDVAKDLGNTVRLTASLGRDGNPLVISEPLELKIVKSAPSPGEVVAARLNERYRKVPAACAGNTPAYYCSGVLARGTYNENFDPWNPSPNAVKLGGVSFTYLRMDSHVTSLAINSGFIFSDQETAIAQNKAQELLCIYPHNAGTSSNYKQNGCGSRQGLLAADLSSCAAKGITTAAQWITHASGIANSTLQCSLSTQVPSQFLAALEAKGTPLRISSPWNEVLVRTWAQNIGEKLPLEAFFYFANVAGADASAKTYQTKFKARTNLWVPVIRLDQTQYGKGNPFEYRAVDQAVQP
ncbi:hypothetical protein [Pseudomonas sp. RW3S2]|uniref:hypothetical protein n=1 Tax=Pseudomonas sp. RW3S2 TaxID=485884 RepID=UPI0016462758|nr:hypothetical protein [Pseudomonas sp. RW3S2]MBC3419063.1 hypothetical protein [Pseudomonas sp. RW3S2]